MQTESYNRQLSLTLDTNGTIKKILTNSHEDIYIKEGDMIVSIINPNCYQIYFDYFSRLSRKESSLGFQINLINNTTVFAYLIEKDNEISFSTIEIEKDGEALFKELLEINNLQANSIRELNKKAKLNTDNKDLFEQIMLLNNSLINTRRELSIKNMKLEELNNILEEVNYRDYLTQLYNRRKFFKDIYEFVTEKEYLLIMMDFNNFKLINDTFGHKRGDEALLYFSQIMTREIAKYRGILYRLGGDEFAVLIDAKNSLDIDGIFQRLDLLLKEIHEDVSMAYGSVLVTKDNCNSNNPAEESMRIADEQMFIKKKNQKRKKNKVY